MSPDGAARLYTPTRRCPPAAARQHHREFSGSSSLYGSLSLRAWLGRLPIPLLPARVGLVAFTDTGRVWPENEASDTWHTSHGGGILLQPTLAPVTVHAIAADSKEGTRFYFGLGYPF